MKNNQISPGQIPHLVRVTADLFREMRKEVKAPNNNPVHLKRESSQMYFMVALLQDLVETAYPYTLEEEEEYHIVQIIETEDGIEESFNQAIEKIKKMVRGQESPKPGDYTW